jgi:hypothetical protein
MEFDMKKVCPKCGTLHEKNGNFCSRSCANSRSWTADAKQKKSKALKKFIAENPTWEEHRLAAMPKMIENLKQTLLEKNNLRFSEGKITSREAIKKQLIALHGEICSVCSLSAHWHGQFLSLHVDHVDGNSKNNMPDNVRLLCPNCHSQTDTYAGKKHRKIKI